MSKLGALLKVSALAGALALTTGVYAASFKVPVNYSVELVDGQTSNFEYNRFDRTITLSPGRHQLVMLFEGTFGNSRESRLYQAANPIVIEITDMPADAQYTFTYQKPRDEREAENYTRSQKINLINDATKAPLSQDEASYYLLTSDSGFAILRDYREDLASVGRLYAPAKVFEEMRSNTNRVSVNENNVTTVQARISGYKGDYANPGTVAPEGNNMAVASVAATTAVAAPGVATVQAKSGGKNAQTPAANATFDQLVQIYESSDDATKLKFVKYIMSH